MKWDNRGRRSSGKGIKNRSRKKWIWVKFIMKEDRNTIVIIYFVMSYNTSNKS